jgi:hypothetical protein
MTSQITLDPVRPRHAVRPRRAAAELPYLREDQRFVMYGVPWETYVALRDALDDRSGIRMTYLGGRSSS